MTSMKQAQIFPVILILQAMALLLPAPGRAQTASSVALTGRVSSQEEGPMEGVLVTVRKADAAFTVTVSSDKQGRYSFPQNRLAPGQYTLNIRAVGYEMDPAKVEVTGQKAATADLKLSKTKDLAHQLTDAEWLMVPAGNQSTEDDLL